METKEILKEIRKQRNLSAKEVADGCNMSLGVYKKYESGERNLGVPALKALADFYNVSTDYLLGRTPVRAMNTLPVGALSEEEVKEIDEAIVTGYTQLSLESRRAFIVMLEELFGNIFEREDFGEEEPPQDSTA
jgi:transcriptional regulator with XRE-family HTH domain